MKFKSAKRLLKAKRYKHPDGRVYKILRVQKTYDGVAIMCDLGRGDFVIFNDDLRIGLFLSDSYDYSRSIKGKNIIFDKHIQHSVLMEIYHQLRKRELKGV